jgi:hypothetical protein
MDHSLTERNPHELRAPKENIMPTTFLKRSGELDHAIQSFSIIDQYIWNNTNWDSSHLIAPGAGYNASARVQATTIA